MTAILFGSIGTIVDTSELQRAAFNAAFRQHDLDWTWDVDEYRSMLDTSGGSNRIDAYAKAHDQTVDADAVHRTKSELFQRAMETTSLSPRPGVADAIRRAKPEDIRLAFVTTTSAQNIEAMLAAVSPEVQRSDFDLVIDISQVDHPKPNPAAYALALDQLTLSAADCMAIEDNVEGVQAADAAGLHCFAFPNENTAGHDFGAVRVVDTVDFDAIRSQLGG